MYNLVLDLSGTAANEDTGDESSNLYVSSVFKVKGENSVFFWEGAD